MKPSSRTLKLASALLLLPTIQFSAAAVKFSDVTVGDLYNTSHDAVADDLSLSRMLPQQNVDELVVNDGSDSDDAEAVHHMADLYLLSSQDMMLKMLNPVLDQQSMRKFYDAAAGKSELNRLDRRQAAPTTNLSYPQAIKHMLELYASADGTQKQNLDQQKMDSAYLHAAVASQSGHLSRRQASVTTDPCISIIGSTFPTNSALFCSGWLAATGGYVAPAFSTACSAANVNSRLSSACSVINSPTKAVTTPAATLATGSDSCASLVTSAFPTNSAAFCQAWLQGGTTQYIAPPFQTACASNSYSRISSVCSKIAASSSAVAPVASVVTGTSPSDVCVSFIKSSFPTNSALFCSNWYNGGTTQYVAPPFQTSCSAANVYSRITSACNVILTSTSNAAAATATSKAPSTPDSCASVITSSFPTNSAVFCSAFYTGGSAQYIAPLFSTACSAINVSSRISSACKTALGINTPPGVVATSTAAASSTSTPTSTNNCIACIASSFPTNSALFCSAWLTQGTTQYVAPPFSTSCAPGNVYSVMTSACNAILSPPSSFTTASATVNPICTTTASWTSMVAKAKIVVPTPSAVALHGPSVLQSNLFVVPNQYFWSLADPLPTLPSSITNQYIPNTALITNYPLYLNGTGSLTIQPGQSLQKLDYQPNLSRDAGKGGVLCGQKMFIFADTGISSPATAGVPGTFEGFVSNSVATDVGLAGAFGKPLTIQDGIGGWSGTAGNMRGFIPLTQGEAAYNAVNEGNGQRYAIWPKSSIIPLTSSTALLYAPIVFCDVNYASGIAAYPLVGVTLSTVTTPGIGGPVANRIAPLMWGANDVEWGTVGGIRSWGPSGPGGSDGSVYVFGATSTGLLLAKVAPANVGNLASYTYYNGAGSFTSAVPNINSTATFISGAFSTADLFYSPRHQTFIMVYQNNYADNQLHWCYLQSDHGIIPGYAGGADADYVANIYKYSWSASQVLLATTVPPAGMYTYGGGSFAGYYDAQDIVNGGTRMLTTWTHPTGENPGNADTSYFHESAEVDWY